MSGGLSPTPPSPYGLAAVGGTPTPKLGAAPPDPGVVGPPPHTPYSCGSAAERKTRCCAPDLLASASRRPGRGYALHLDPCGIPPYRDGGVGAPQARPAPAASPRTRPRSPFLARPRPNRSGGTPQPVRWGGAVQGRPRVSSGRGGRGPGGVGGCCPVGGFAGEPPIGGQHRVPLRTPHRRRRRGVEPGGDPEPAPHGTGAPRSRTMHARAARHRAATPASPPVPETVPGLVPGSGGGGVGGASAGPRAPSPP